MGASRQSEARRRPPDLLGQWQLGKSRSLCHDRAPSTTQLTHWIRLLSDASYTMPRAIMWTVGPNAALGFLMAVTLVFTLGDAREILATSTGQPFIQVFYNAVRSLPGTNAMVAIVILCLTACCISEVATAPRQLWSFARDAGLPGSRWLSHVCVKISQIDVRSLTR